MKTVANSYLDKSGSPSFIDQYGWLSPSIKPGQCLISAYVHVL